MSINGRDFVSFASSGIGAAAFASLLMKDGIVRAAGIPSEAKDAPPHHAAKAKRVIHICLCGGMSHLDSFDYKPELTRLHGKPLGGSEKPDVFFGQIGLLRKNDWEFQQRGKSALSVSELSPPLSRVHGPSGGGWAPETRGCLALAAGGRAGRR